MNDNKKSGETSGEKTIVVNRKARHDYHLSDRLEAGIALVGTEVKSLRQGKVNVTDSYIDLRDGEAVVVGLHINPYDHTVYGNHDPVRPRKLLLHRREIKKLERQVSAKGYTLIPTRLYFKDGRVKVEISLARGKGEFDKREDIKARDAKLEIRDAVG